LQVSGANPGEPGYAVFPNEAVGQQARFDLLRSASYRNLTIHKAIDRYSDTDVATYQAFVRDETGFGDSAVLATLRDAQLRSLAAAMREYEDWEVGSVEIRTGGR